MKLTVTVFMLLFSMLVQAQQSAGSLQGNIISAEKQPAEGVTVLLKNTIKTAVADNGGFYEIKNIEPGDYTLVVSLVGHSDVEKKVSILAGKTTTENIALSLSSKDLNEVVIVANKNSFKTNRMSSSLRLQSPILEIPQNVQVVTSRLIYNQQIFDMLEGVTRNISGAARVEHWDNYARITMRGSNVGAFRNGMNVSTTWGPLTEDMSMVERIEFIKGPAGFMLANGDPSGFYNVVTKKPSGRTKNEVALSLGSFGFYRASADMDGLLSKNGKLQYRLNVMGQLKGTQRQFDYNNRYSIVPVLKYAFTNKTALTLEYTRQFAQVNVIGSNYSFSKKGYADLPKEYTTAEDNIPATTMNDNSLLMVFTHSFNAKWKITAQGAYFNYQQRGSSLWPVAFDAANDSLMQRGMSIWDVSGISKMAQAFVNGEFKTGAFTHKILAGIDISTKDYYHDWNQGGPLGSTDFNIYAPVYGTGIMPVYDRSKSLEERGVRYYNQYSAGYVQDEVGMFQNRLRVTLAGRYTSLKAGDVYSGDAKTNKLTPRVGVSFSIDKNTALYFVSDQSITENYGTDWQGKAFDPIEGTNIELGFKRDWLNGKWNSSLSIYQITRNNVLTTDYDHERTDESGNPTGQFFNRQSGQQQTRGIEADIRGQVAKNLDIVINYAYTDAKVTKDSDKDIIGTQVAGSSKHVHNTWLNYKMDKGKLTGLGFSLGYQYQAKRSPWYIATDVKQQLPDYFRLDGGVSYQVNPKLGLNLLVNNILNKYLYSGGFYPWGGYYYWQAEAGTNCRFSVNYRF